MAAPSIYNLVNRMALQAEISTVHDLICKSYEPIQRATLGLNEPSVAYISEAASPPQPDFDT